MLSLMILKTLSLQNNLIYIGLSVLIFKLISINIYCLAFLFLLIKVRPRFIIMGLVIYALSVKDITPPTECVIVDRGEYNLCSGKTSIYLEGEFDVGDKLNIKGDFKSPPSASSPYTFDYANYLKGKNIYYQIYKPGIIRNGNSFSIYKLRDIVKGEIEKYPLISKKYLSALIVGDKQYFSSEEMSLVSELGISHLLAISGLHVGLLCLGLEKLTKNKVIIAGIIFTYMLVAGFSPSITRAGAMYILSVSFRKYNFSNLDALTAVFLGYFIMNNNVVYDIGFQLSFLVTLSIILTRPTSLFQVSIVAQLVTLPLLINMYNQINIITVFVNIYFIILMSYIILPLSFLNFLVDIDQIYAEVVRVFDKIIVLSSDFNMIVQIRNVEPLMTIAYYLLLIRKPRLGLILISVLLFLPPKQGVYFLDVGQGDSTLIVKEDVVLVDTGGKVGKDITLRNVIPLLKSIGVREIDYLVLTHEHYDHYGGYSDILDSFNVKNIVISKYSKFDFAYPNTLKLEQGDRFSTFEVLSPDKLYSSINNHSLVLKFYYQGKSIILMADSELKEAYGDVDILKLGHHGSKTSLNEEMYAEFDPDEVIISVGRNSYGLPNTEVLMIVESAVAYRTDRDGTIILHNIEDGLLRTIEYKRRYFGSR